MIRRLHLLLVCVFFSGLSICFAQADFRLAIEVRDQYSKRIIPAIISVVATGSETELVGQMLDDKYVVRVKSGGEYRLFVAFQEYKTLRQTLIFDKKANLSGDAVQILTLDLEPLNPPQNLKTEPVSGLTTISVIDRKQRSSVSQASITIKNAQSNQGIAITKTGNGNWSVSLKENENYIVEVAAPDYENYKDFLKIKPREPVEISLNRIAKQNLWFQAVDALSGQLVSARFKLTDKIRETYSGTTSLERPSYEVSVPVQAQAYELTVTAAGYRSSQSSMFVTANLAPEQGRRVVKLSKSDVFLKLQIIDAQTLQPLAGNVRVLDQTNKKAILDVKNAPKGQAAVQLNPERRYVIEVESAGFMPYQQALEKAIEVLESENNLVVKLNKMGDSFVSLSAIDAATGKRVAATFKLISTQNEATEESKTTPTALSAKVKITEPDVFKIEASAPGYRTHKGELDAEEFGVGKVFNYEAVLMPEPKKVVETPKIGEQPKTIEPPKVAEKPKVVEQFKTTEPPKVAEEPKLIEKPKIKETKVVSSVFVFHFRTTDAQTKKIIKNARLKVFSAVNRQLVAGKGNSSDFKTELQASQNYLLEVEMAGYEKLTLKIETLANADQTEYRREIALTKKVAAAKTKRVVNDKIFDNVKLGEAVTVEDNVYFDQSSYILRPESNGQLNRLAALMAKNAKLKVEIGGHTDNVGDPRLNLSLSEYRAKVIANYLINRGIVESRIKFVGHGQTKPLTANDSEDNRKRNRRVEFTLKEN